MKIPLCTRRRVWFTSGGHRLVGRDTPELGGYEEARDCAGVMNYKYIAAARRGGQLRRGATMRSGNCPRFDHGVADELGRLAGMSAHRWMPAPERFRSGDPETKGDGVGRARIGDVLYVTTPEGGLVDLPVYAHVDTGGEGFSPDLLACLYTYHRRVSTRFSNHRQASCQVKRRKVESIVEGFAARVAVTAPEPRD